MLLKDALRDGREGRREAAQLEALFPADHRGGKADLGQTVPSQVFCCCCFLFCLLVLGMQSFPSYLSMFLTTALPPTIFPFHLVLSTGFI